MEMIHPIDPELLDHCEATWLETITALEARPLMVRLSEIDETHPTYQTLLAIQRVSGGDPVTFDTSHPDFSWDAVHAYIRENWWGRQS